VPETRRIVVPADAEEERLDRVLTGLASDLSRAAVSRLIDEGLVAVDGMIIAKRSTRVAGGAEIVVEIPDPAPTDVVPQDLPLTLLYQDEDIVVVDKPAGLVVHPAAGHADGTLVNALLHHVKDLSGIGGESRPGLVHRLDKDTSGVIVVAKNDRAHRLLTEVWGTAAVAKEYLAVVYGTPKERKGMIDRKIGRDPRDRKRMAVTGSGRRAVTHYEVVDAFAYTSLLRCRLETGRTHQIRVHLKALGHPVVGDPVYSGPQWKGIPNKRIQKALASFSRQALHSVSLAFPHPSSGERVAFEAPIPDDIKLLIETLRNEGR
jgi:23S rRNA pseudouridine1911/1915/1917 synthase